MRARLLTAVGRARPDVVWASLIAAGTAYEVFGLTGGREGYTLSENVRAAFHVDSPVGRLAFAGGWLALSAWFVPHIIDKAAAAAVEVLEMSPYGDISPLSPHGDMV